MSLGDAYLAVGDDYLEDEAVDKAIAAFDDAAERSWQSRVGEAGSRSGFAA